MITCNRYRSRVCFIFLIHPTAFLRADVTKWGVSESPGRCPLSAWVSHCHTELQLAAHIPESACQESACQPPKPCRVRLKRGLGWAGHQWIPGSNPQLCPKLWRPRRHMRTPQPPAEAAVRLTDLSHIRRAFSTRLRQSSDRWAPRGQGCLTGFGHPMPCDSAWCPVVAQKTLVASINTMCPLPAVGRGSM